MSEFAERLTLWHNVRYENQIGFVCLTKPLKTVNDTIIVKVGYVQSRAYFRAYHLFPEITTGRPMPFASPAQIGIPVISTVGKRVIIHWTRRQ